MNSLPRGSQASPPVPAAGKSPGHRPADDLVIAGLVPMSTVDWPDHLTATVFLQGCPWNCFYCHNRDLIPTRTPGRVAWEEVRALLRRRRGLLDGVVLTGGEALRQDALADAAREVIDMGFQVGLHTAGPYPRRLRDMVGAGLVDWVGLDIKALPEHYGQVVGREGAAARAWESLEVLVEVAGRGGPDFEVRTTVVPGDVTADDAVEVARRVHAAGARVYALQQARSEGTYLSFISMTPVENLTLQNVKYTLDSKSYEYPVALVSNEFTADKMTISFAKGLILVAQTRDHWR